MVKSANMIELRPYQQALLRQSQDALAESPTVRLMLQLPTGGGKTVIAGALLSNWLQDGRKAVWLTHRKELAEQTCRMLTDAGVSAITNVNWTPGEDAPAMAGGAVILMAQTVGRRNARREVWNRYGARDLLVIDEAHHAAAPGWERAMRQWPGPIVGMTATPWRLSEREGFDHLFDALLCGPQSADLQALDSPALCRAQVFIPPQEERVAAGDVNRTGDYSESGIEQANRDRPDVLTAGALAFWMKHAHDRPTIAYAVSVDHAHNLAAVFNEAGIVAAVILGDSSREQRDAAIAAFRAGDIRVLVNVIVATEGFDLPDASCVIIARPTMSLALYLQMVGRGLRPKPDGGDCLILDLAANAVTHGLPEDYREWSLEPRGTQSSGEAPVVCCPVPWCEAVSPAASHNCRVCGHAFGKDCDRCGRWRAHKRWQYEKRCGDTHQMVCDLCHIDAHIQAHLPVAPPLDELVYLRDTEDEMTLLNDVEIGDDLGNRLSDLFDQLLEIERQSIAGTNDARRSELAQLVDERQRELNDDNELEVLFSQHIATLPHRPSRVQERRIFAEWEEALKSELRVWQGELLSLDAQPVDKQAIYESARNKAAHLLLRAAEKAELLPDSQTIGTPLLGPFTPRPYPGEGMGDPPAATHEPLSGGGIFAGTDQENRKWRNLSDLRTAFDSGLQPEAVSFPNGDEQSVTNWRQLHVTVANWLVDKGLLSQDGIPSQIDNLISRNQEWFPSGVRKFRELKNGLFVYANYGAAETVVTSCRLLEAFGEDLSSFYVRLIGVDTNLARTARYTPVRERPPDGLEPKRFYIVSNRNGILAECDVYNRQRIVILAGSTATKRRLNEHYSALQNRKDALVSDGTLTDGGRLYTFTRDYPTTSASAAAGIVLGNTGTTKPLQSLKDAGGIPVGEYFLRQV